MNQSNSNTKTCKTSSKGVVLITGAGKRRLGFETAKYLGECGYSIALHFNKSQQEAQQSLVELIASGITARSFQADITSQSEIEQLGTAVKSEMGSIDGLVTTASIWEPTPINKISDGISQQIQVNAIGTIHCCQIIGLMMSEQPSGGSIITVGDWAVEQPYEDHVGYFAAKGAVVAATRSLAVDLASLNPKIRVNCINPGPVLFPDRFDQKTRDRIQQETLLKHVDDPAAFAETVEFFLRNKMATGQVINIDSGRGLSRHSPTAREQ